MALNQGNLSPQNNMIASFSFASTVHVTQWSNYLTQQAEILTRRSNLTPQRGKNRSVSLSRNKKNKLKTIQWKKLRNWDVIEDKKIRHFSKF